MSTSRGTEIQKRFSACWERFLGCFKKGTETDGGVRVRDEEKGAVIENRAVTTREQYIALYDYSPRTNGDLRFYAGDLLEVLDKSAGEWWFAKAITGLSASKQGYIPANYVAHVESLDAQPWYFPETKRIDAEKMLLAGQNHNGAFLIRNCESQKGEYSLSVLDCGRVKHYKLRKLESGQYYVSRTRCFESLKELVEHYSRQADGLCVQLGEPCKKMEAPQTYGLSYNTVDQWEIDRNSVRLLKKLGAGQFGEVWEGIWNNTTAVAVKTLKPGMMDPADFLREAQIMKMLRHAKLIQLYAVCTMEDPIYIITELMKNGSLLDYLKKDAGSTLSLNDQIEMAAQVASGMAFLELHNYIHRDLAARNVLVGENNLCKVADFGLARLIMKETEKVYESKGPIQLPVKWTAPEALHDSRFSIKSDVWSFGILLHEIMTFGQMPYPEFSNIQTITKISQGYRMPCPRNCPKVMYEIMLDCWKENEQERPTFETLQWKLEDYFDMDVTSYSSSCD